MAVLAAMLPYSERKAYRVLDLFGKREEAHFGAPDPDKWLMPGEGALVRPAAFTLCIWRAGFPHSNETNVGVCQV